MQKISTFFMFQKDSLEAMEFYTSIFPDSRILYTMPGRDGKPAGGAFVLAGQEYKCFDGGTYFSFSQGISLFVSCDTQDEIDYYWAKLIDGGEEQQCGWLVDKFGVSWQIIPGVLGELLSDPDPSRSQRAMQAMLQMRKLNIAELQRAADGHP